MDICTVQYNICTELIHHTRSFGIKYSLFYNNKSKLYYLVWYMVGYNGVMQYFVSIFGCKYVYIKYCGKTQNRVYIFFSNRYKCIMCHVLLHSILCV